jgi:hypothetical protein
MADARLAKPRTAAENFMMILVVWWNDLIVDWSVVEVWRFDCVRCEA